MNLLKRTGKAEKKRLQSCLPCPAVSVVWELTHHSLCINKIVQFSVNSQNRDAHFSPAKFPQSYPSLSQHLLPPSILKPLHMTLEQERDKLQGFQLHSVKGGGCHRVRSSNRAKWMGRSRQEGGMRKTTYSMPRMIDQGSSLLQDTANRQLSQVFWR